jgi:hypothetical protein
LRQRVGSRLVFPSCVRPWRWAIVGGWARRLVTRAGCADRVERVGLAARATLAPQPTDLKHSLPVGGEEAGEARTKRASALNCERASTRRALIDKLQGLRVPGAVRGDVGLDQDRSADDMEHRERVPVAMRIDADHVVQLICKHP